MEFWRLNLAPKLHKKRISPLPDFGKGLGDGLIIFLTPTGFSKYLLQIEHLVNVTLSKYSQIVLIYGITIHYHSSAN